MFSPIFLARAISPSSSRHCARPGTLVASIMSTTFISVVNMVACMASRAMDCHALVEPPAQISPATLSLCSIAPIVSKNAVS